MRALADWFVTNLKLREPFTAFTWLGLMLFLVVMTLVLYGGKISESHLAFKIGYLACLFNIGALVAVKIKDTTIRRKDAYVLTPVLIIVSLAFWSVGIWSKLAEVSMGWWIFGAVMPFPLLISKQCSYAK